MGGSKVAPVSPKRKTALDPFVERLYEGVVVYSKSWQEDLWLYFKNEHIILSMYCAHPKHPFNATDRSMVGFISLMVAYGLNCCFSSLQSSTLATILSMTVGIVVQSTFDASLKFFSTCPCVQKGCLASIRCIRSCCLALGKVFTMCCCCLGLIVLLLGIILLVAIRPEEFGSASINFGGSKGAAFFGSTVAMCVFSFITKRRKQMRPFLIDSVGRDQKRARDWIQNGYKTQEELDQALKKWTAKPKLYFRGRDYPWAWCCCVCCCIPIVCVTIGGGSRKSLKWEKYFRKYYEDEDLEAQASPESPKSKKGKKATQEEVDIKFDELLTFEDLPEHCPRYRMDVSFCGCIQFGRYNVKIPEEYKYKELTTSRLGVVIKVASAVDKLKPDSTDAVPGAIVEGQPVPIEGDLKTKEAETAKEADAATESNLATATATEVQDLKDCQEAQAEAPVPKPEA